MHGDVNNGVGKSTANKVTKENITQISVSVNFMIYFLINDIDKQSFFYPYKAVSYIRIVTAFTFLLFST